MYKVDMYYTVKTLLEKGNSQRKISRLLGIHRNTVRKIKSRIEAGETEPPPIKKASILDPYREEIKQQVENNKSAVLIHDFLVRQKGLYVAYTTVVKYVRGLKQREVYVPMLCGPGEEAQVDFGYFGRFKKDGKWRKVWVFSMILSHSRYAYFERVLDQSVETFIRCHIHAFEYFGGVPYSVKIDNLKAGVITPSFYEPVIQHQYAEFLAHYGSAPITARIARGQDKGKVESGIKYVKNNFLGRIDHKDYYRLGDDLRWWLDHVCNQRLHGTTRKVPSRVFHETEKGYLQQLPQQRFELYYIGWRKVDLFYHIHFDYNYYSVPSRYSGYDVTVKSNGQLLKIYYERTLIAIHTLAKGQGKRITREEHKPVYKQRYSRAYYEERIKAIGDHASTFQEELEKDKPRHWYEMMKGILNLEKSYSRKAINLSCKRAILYGAVSYRAVKNILEKGLYKESLPEDYSSMIYGGYGHELSKYDQI